MSENIIFEQKKLGACVIPLFRVILRGKIHLYPYFCTNITENDLPLLKLMGLFKVIFKVKRSILGSSE